MMRGGLYQYNYENNYESPAAFLVEEEVYYDLEEEVSSLRRYMYGEEKNLTGSLLFVLPIELTKGF